ncbi:MAG: hypothetical protein JST59_01025 [Actinobacteria bacterium]|nr:hypothetical protein [Actinomycetota bacterium]
MQDGLSNPPDYRIIKIFADSDRKFKNDVFMVKSPQMPDFSRELEYPLKANEELTVKIRANMP